MFIAPSFELGAGSTFGAEPSFELGAGGTFGAEPSFELGVGSTFGAEPSFELGVGSTFGADLIYSDNVSSPLNREDDADCDEFSLAPALAMAPAMDDSTREASEGEQSPEKDWDVQL